jgi:hypothetical protein
MPGGSGTEFCRKSMPAALGKRTGAMAEKHSPVVERDLVPRGAVKEKLSLQ